MYFVVGLYQNFVLIDEPTSIFRYLGDIRVASEFTFGVSFNQVGPFGNPATFLYGVVGVLVSAALGSISLYSLLARVLRNRSAGGITVLSLLILLSTGVPMMLLFAYGGLGFIAGRFREQLLIWVLLPVLPLALVCLTHKSLARLCTILMVAGIAASLVGSMASPEITAQSYLSAPEVQTSHFVWAKLPASEFVFSDWVRGTSLMYYHRYIYGPDPYRMPPPLFRSITVALYYQSTTSNLKATISSILQTQNFSIYLSTRMISSGPTGPDYLYQQAVPNLITRFELEPDFDLVYSTGETVILQSTG
jgi:hypothetical protein